MWQALPIFSRKSHAITPILLVEVLFVPTVALAKSPCLGICRESLNSDSFKQHRRLKTPTQPQFVAKPVAPLWRF